MTKAKQGQNYPLVLEQEIKNAASGIARSKGIPLSVAIRAYISALVKGDKRALAILEEAAKKK